MIAYTVVGTNDLEKATQFYDAILGVIGAKPAMNMPRGRLYATAPNAPMFGVMQPFDGNAASVGNGMMIAIAAPNKDAVTAIHAKAIELGGTCEGQPGERGMPGVHFAYFRDLDGNKVAVMARG